MIRLKEENIGEYIQKYVPEQYHPGNGRMVITLAPIDIANLALLASAYMKRDVSELLLGGICINTGLLLQSGKKEFDIFVKEHYESENEIAFVILHEVGHVDWWVNDERREKFRKEDNELYADLFAFERIADISGMDVAIDALCHYASGSGFGKEMLKGDYNE